MEEGKAGIRRGGVVVSVVVMGWWPAKVAGAFGITCNRQKGEEK
jgi:hypothetical protein